MAGLVAAFLGAIALAGTGLRLVALEVFWRRVRTHHPELWESWGGGFFLNRLGKDAESWFWSGGYGDLEDRSLRLWAAVANGSGGCAFLCVLTILVYGIGSWLVGLVG